MKNKNQKTPQVAVIMGSDSDYPTMKEAAAMLDYFGIAYELDVVSAHRTPQKMYEFAKGAHERGLKAIIAGAGGAAHLPGMVASITILPVIGVPILSKSRSGVDSLHSIVQMPPGVPVNTMAIGGAKNAGIAAAQIVGVGNAEVRKKLQKYKEELVDLVDGMSEKVKS